MRRSCEVKERNSDERRREGGVEVLMNYISNEESLRRGGL